jgi:hypothetical protein
MSAPVDLDHQLRAAGQGKCGASSAPPLPARGQAVLAVGHRATTKADRGHGGTDASDRARREGHLQAGFNYAKAGVMLLDLQDASVEQQKLALDEGPPILSSLMERWIGSTNDTGGDRLRLPVRGNRPGSGPGR